MNIINYIRDKRIDFIISLFVFVVINFFLAVLEIQIEVNVVISLLYLVAWIIPMLFDYQRRKQFYSLFINQLEQLDQKYLIVELLKRPDFYDGELLYDSLREINHSMLEYVNFYKLSQKEYKEFIEMWIHEVKIPLSTSKLIIQNHPSKEMKMIDDELNQLNDYLEQALFYARSQYVEKDYVVRDLLLDGVVDKVIKRNSRLFITKKIKIELDVKDVHVSSDSKWLEFILQQIIQNALKYTKEQEGVIRIWTEELKYNTLLHIDDNGIGIQDKDIGRVFEKGFTGDTGRMHHNATGIGLYLCKMLCDKLHLNIQVASKDGVQVTLNFPRGK